MAIYECFTAFAIKKKRGKRKIVGEAQYYHTFPDDELLEQFIKAHEADSAVVLLEHELGDLPFE